MESKGRLGDLYSCTGVSEKLAQRNGHKSGHTALHYVESAKRVRGKMTSRARASWSCITRRLQQQGPTGLSFTSGQGIRRAHGRWNGGI